MLNIQVKGLTGPHMRRLIAALLLISLLGQIQALPNGIDGRGDNGCICHGGADDSTSVTLEGLPGEYNSSQEYNITLTIESPVEMNDVQGGFRIIISEGEIIGDGWQFMDGGYTHSEEINDRRVWNAVWVAPAEDDVLATFIIYGNAVNGDGAASSEDEWNSQSLAVPGPEYTGDASPIELSNSVSNSQKAIAVIALLGVITLTVVAIRD
jgi:hypothetical protein